MISETNVTDAIKANIEKLVIEAILAGTALSSASLNEPPKVIEKGSSQISKNDLFLPKNVHTNKMKSFSNAQGFTTVSVTFTVALSGPRCRRRCRCPRSG